MDQYKIEGILICCDLSGKVLELVYDGLKIGANVKNGESFLNILDEGSINKGSNFINKIKTENAIFNWELNIPYNQKMEVIHFSGFLINRGMLIIGVNSFDKMSNFIEELSRINSEQANFLRKQMKNANNNIYSELNDNKLYDEMSLLNNELTNTKRELTKTNLQLEQSLEEKKMLLKEIHHRVKNNLMVISSLLSLQSQYIKDKYDLDLFKESQNRAKSMALIHERLYRSTDLKSINFGDYIQTLATDLFETYVTDPDRIKLNMNLENEMVDINTTVPLGLIVNELITNSMKHAFNDDIEGEIKIKFQKKNDKFTLIVEDTGIGFPDDLDFKNTESLGLQLVNSLTNQIDGKIELDAHHGTKFKITFKEFLNN